MESENRKSYRRGFLGGVLLAILIVMLYSLGSKVYSVYVKPYVSLSSSTNVGEKEILLDTQTSTKIEVIEGAIQQYFLNDISLKNLEDGIYSGILDALEDPYSEYYTAEELISIQEKTEGIYYGIGAYIGIDEKTNLSVLSGIIENTPAQEAGLQAGDVIYKVDGVSTEGKDTTEVVALIKGEEGSKVLLTIIRQGEAAYLEIEVERRKIETPTVEYKMLEDNIGYIRILEFDDITLDQFTEALAVCEGSGMTGLILDLRNNPGGNLTTVCEIARMLLPKGLIVYTENKYGEREEYSGDGTREIQIPLVVLTNEYSASASEILAGAIKDYEKGTILGTTTYGKGIVQRIIGLSDGSALKLTVSKYYTPKGNDIHGIGVSPDVEVKFDSETYLLNGKDNQLEAAISLLKNE
ncbi:MAG: S41 family peptidase [Lachnospiraceae bacterium]